MTDDQGKPDRCPMCGSDERGKCNLLPTPAGYEDLCCDDWHSSPVPAAAPQHDDDLGGYGDHGKLAQVLFRAPQAESVPSGKDAATLYEAWRSSQFQAAKYPWVYSSEREACAFAEWYAAEKKQQWEDNVRISAVNRIAELERETAALAAERDQLKKHATWLEIGFADMKRVMIDSLGRRDDMMKEKAELERSNSLLRERITAAEGLLKIISDPPHDCCGCDDHSKANADCCAYVNYHCPECFAGAYFEKENQ